MKIENQVCSWEQGMKLMELGVKNEGQFMYETYSYYGEERHATVPFDRYDNEHGDGGGKDQWDISKDCSAFTVAELGVMIPSEYYLPTNKGEDGWWVSNIRQPDFQKLADTEAEARAEVLIFLLENKVVDIEEVNKILQND